MNPEQTAPETLNPSNLRDLIHDQPGKGKADTPNTKLKWECAKGCLIDYDPHELLCGKKHEPPCHWQYNNIYGKESHTADKWWGCVMGLNGWDDKMCHREPRIHLNPPTARYCTYTCHNCNSEDRVCGCEYRRGETGRGGFDQAICVRCTKQQSELICIDLQPPVSDPASEAYYATRICPLCSTMLNWKTIQESKVVVSSSFLRRNQWSGRYRWLCKGGNCRKINTKHSVTCGKLGCNNGRSDGVPLLDVDQWESGGDKYEVNVWRGDGNESNRMGFEYHPNLWGPA